MKGGYQIIDLGVIVLGDTTTHITEGNIYNIFKNIHDDYLNGKDVKPILLKFTTADSRVASFMATKISANGIDIVNNNLNDFYSVSLVYLKSNDEVTYSINEI